MTRIKRKEIRLCDKFVLTCRFSSEGHTQKARLSAIAYRKKRWICFILTLIILAIIGIVVGVEVAQHTNKSSNNNSQ